MSIKCTNCGSLNELPAGPPGTQYHCYKCGAFLPSGGQQPGSTSAAVGLLGGAALGAAIAGPVGALVGAVIGAIIGNEAKGVG